MKTTMRAHLGSTLVAAVLLLPSSEAFAYICGDGIVEGPEQCDLGTDNSDFEPDGCRTNCVLAHCGDGVVDSLEECDDSVWNHDLIPDRCRTDCSLPSCGDGTIDDGEQCDDGGAGGIPPSTTGGATTGSGVDECTSTCLLIALVECETGVQYLEDEIGDLQANIAVYQSDVMAGAADDVDAMAVDATSSTQSKLTTAAGFLEEAALANAAGDLKHSAKRIVSAIEKLDEVDRYVSTTDVQYSVARALGDRAAVAYADVFMYADADVIDLTDAASALSQGETELAAGDAVSAVEYYREAVKELYEAVREDDDD